jgi:addiction module HigA family antidote
MSIPMNPSRRPPPIHPGEFLREDYLPELSLHVDEFAQQLHIPLTELEDVLSERRGISSDLAYRLALYFQTSPEFWTNLQTAYELNTIYHSRLDEITREVRPRRAA